MPKILSKIKLVIFDVNQTMFSLTKVENIFKRNGLRKELVDQWFLSILKEGFSYSLSGKFVDFKTVSRNELKKIFLQSKIILKKNLDNLILDSFRSLEIHSDIPVALSFFKQKKIKIITVTNGSKSNTQILLKKNKIDHLIDDCFSIDQFRKWKPHRDIYLSVCKLMKIEPKYSLMIAAHGWDINGAKLAGLKTAYITRYEKEISDFYLKPDFAGKDCNEIIKQFNL